MNPASILYDYLQQKNLLKKRFIVAVSGGRDSMCLLHACHKLELDIVAAHCNFKLRSDESDGDEAFVMSYCADHKIPLEKIHFNTKKTAAEKNLSTQETARYLRYEWFESIRKQHEADYIITAHHGGDTIETFMINLLRGTGLKGLTGIPAENGFILRPLLSVLKPHIDEYVTSFNIPFRNDSTNESDAYTRNYIRHHIVPLFEHVNEKALNHILHTASVLSESEALIKDLLIVPASRYTEQNGPVFSIHLEPMMTLPYKRTLLHYWLTPYGFNQATIDDVTTAHQTGKKWFSETHHVTYERGTLNIAPISENTLHELTFYSSLPETVEFGESIYTINMLSTPPVVLAVNTLYLDASMVKYPVTLRHWKQGDSFAPLGMKHHKKLSDFFIDMKLTALQKKQALILEAGGEIIAVAPYRISSHVKITKQTSSVIAITPVTKKQA